LDGEGILGFSNSFACVVFIMPLLF